MKLFACQSCQQVVFFESVQCLRCGHLLAYLPDRGEMSAMDPMDGEAQEAWRPVPADSGGADAAAATTRYRLCRNYVDHAVCNWAVPAGEPDELCRSCRLNHLIPALDDAHAKEAWHRIEIAKRRLIHTLLELGLPVETKAENPSGGLAFDLLEGSDQPGAPPVFTGHNEGLITINIAEADDPFREKMRVQMGEAYRTLLGHFRHESGHYYWERLIKPDTQRLEAFRARFGDERTDYDAARTRHYEDGAPPDWPARHVSSYASMHPWEDWAETWAHVLHVIETLGTARAYGLSLKAPGVGAPKGAVVARKIDRHAFDDLMAGWIPLTEALNSLNRSMGTPDIYPFVLAEAAIEKMRFAHGVIESWA